MEQTDPTEGGPLEAEETIALGGGSAGAAGPEETIAHGSGPPDRDPAARSPEYTFLEPPQATDELGRIAHYRVLKKVGEGGMGLVFLAEDAHLRRPVALKVIRPDLAKSPETTRRFLREARMAAAIRHDNVVTVYQVGQQGEVPFLAMEYLQGVSLHRWLDRGKAATVEQILRIGREVASGLAAAHALGLVHRDIKPGNIWLEAPHGRAKILDFGHARAERAEDVQITRAGAIMGTPAFMAPEQARGEPVVAASDLFSLGCVLYRLAAGRLPFPGTTIMAVLTALATVDPPHPRTLNPDIPPSLDALIMRLLSKDPAGRPESARAVVEALRDAEHRLAGDRQAAELGSSLHSPDDRLISDRSPSPKPGDSAHSRRRRRTVVVAIGLIFLGLALARRSGRGRIDHRRGGPPSPIVAPAPVELASGEQGTGASAPRSETDPTIPPPVPPIVPPALPPEPVPLPPPTPVEVRPQPKETPKPPEPGPSAVATEPVVPPMSSEWGTFIDPEGDCKASFDRERARVTIGVPAARPHALSVEVGLMNAPRILRPIRGDFEATVKVVGTDLLPPSARPTTNEYNPYHGGGLLLWEDGDNYVRLEVATDIRGKKPVHYANFEYRKAGKLASSRGLKFDDGSTHLRLERRGREVRASFSPDGHRWTKMPTLTVSLADPIQVGLAAINTASKPLLAEFEGLEIRPSPEPPAAPGRP